MTKTSFEPKTFKVSTDYPAQATPRTESVTTETGTEKSSFQSASPDAWKALSTTDTGETPSVIGDMMDAVDETASRVTTQKDAEQSYLGGFMCGDDGALRVSDGANLNVEDHEEISIPSARNLFIETPALQQNTYPILERFTLLQKTIAGLIDVNTDTLRKGGLSQSESEGIKSYLNYLYDRMHLVQKELDVVDYYRQNELGDRKQAIEEIKTAEEAARTAQAAEEAAQAAEEAAQAAEEAREAQEERDRLIGTAIRV
jgi:hypothetical protein